MAPKRNASANTPSATPPSAASSGVNPGSASSHSHTASSKMQASASTTTRISAGSSSTSTSRATLPSKDPRNVQDIAATLWNKYLEETPQRVKLVDVFMAFLVIVGALQFVYVVLVGNYPFNAFLSGFSATVGQFVLTVSLRIQTNPVNRSEFHSTSDERAFADYVLGSLLLHFFCINFIN